MPELTSATESEDSCEDSKVPPSRRELFLLSHRPGNALVDVHDLPSDSIYPTSKQSTTLGSRPKDLATSPASLHRLRLTAHVHCHLLLVLERWPSKSRESRRLLLRLCCHILRPQHRHVGSWRRCTAALQKQLWE